MSGSEFHSRVKQSEAAFGCDAIGECQFLIRGFEAYRLVRCFEAWKRKVRPEACGGVCGALDGTSHLVSRTARTAHS